MNKAPFTELKQPRRVELKWMPEDLRDFYSTREGIGREADPETPIRLCKLAEVKRMKWADLHLLGDDEPPPGWAGFAAIRLGVDSYFDDIVWVLSAPSAKPGSIMAFGVDVAGPGGAGEHAFGASLVLDVDFDHWLTRLERDEWTEYGLVPGSIKDLGPRRTKELNAHFKRLNPAWIGDPQ